MLVTHRLANVRHADQIVVLERGPGHRARPARRADGAAAAPTTSCSPCRPRAYADDSGYGRAVTELVHLDLADGVATITLDSPANRNALSAQLRRELLAHLDTAIADPAARVIVLTHTGPVFCSGMDLKESRGAERAATRGSPSSRRSWSGSGPRRPRCWPGSAGPARAGGVGPGRGLRHRGGRRRGDLRVQRGADRGGAGGHLGDRAAPAAARGPRTSCSSPARPSTPPRRPGSG